MASRNAAGLKAKLALFLPGIFLLGFNIGTGSVTTMAKAGASYGRCSSHVWQPMS
jgi:hypothetical protein